MTDQRLLILDDNLLTGRAIAGIAEFMGIDVRLTTDFDGFIHWLRERDYESIARVVEWARAEYGL